MSRKLGPPYEWRSQKQKPPQPGGFLIAKYIYTFYASGGKKYNLEVEQYPSNIYILKFYLAANVAHPDRFNMLADIGFAAARKLLDTCFHVMSDILRRNPLASGGFIGAPKILKKKKHKAFGRKSVVQGQKLEDVEQTQRYRVYTLLARNYFSPKNWDHYDFGEESLYLLVNRNNPQTDIPQVAWDLYNNLKDIPQDERRPFPIKVVGLRS
jgi:hypothetical protein